MSDGLQSRAIAIAALKSVFEHRNALETGFTQAPDFRRMAASDRAFSFLLAATVLRRRGQIAAALDHFLEKPLPEQAGDTRIILEAGAAQILFLDTPPHAAVSSSVALAKRHRASVRFAGLINAVLRKISKGGRLVARGTPFAANLPDWVRASWEKAYGEDRTEAIAEAFSKSPPLDVTLKDEAQASAMCDALSAEQLPTGTLRRKDIGDVTKLTGFADGAWWVQDAGAALPAKLLAARPGEDVLDMCAAPGGKTMQLAASGASVTAVEASPKRTRRIKTNLERTQLSAELISADGREWGEDESFDAILLDAPCSATGTLRRRPDAAFLKDQEDVDSLADIQHGLFDNCARLLKPGGRVVVCTCSLQPEEGEDWLAASLERNPGLKIDPARPEELPELESAILDNGSVRLSPEMWSARGGIDGFFIARLVKA